ncbi:MAG: class I SAM-dependent methyltransferase [Thermodesulfobacteriota bacterium]|jgi:O-antigen chain-terminating methyltransferase
MKPFSYSDYESRLMDSEYIRMLQLPRVRFFKDCKRVLDLACGPGVFLELLKEAGIQAMGVDRDEQIVMKARLKNLDVIQADIFEHLERAGESYDGIFCSHFLEHIPFDRVVRLIELIANGLDPGGVLVFVLPNPGSIRLHLFGFWRDPEHVRFYTGNLIASVCQHYGLSVVTSNEEETPNLLETPRLEPISALQGDSRWKGFWGHRDDRAEIPLLQLNRKIEEFNQKMEKFSEAVNKMWARDDEVVIVAKKRM